MVSGASLVRNFLEDFGSLQKALISGVGGIIAAFGIAGTNLTLAIGDLIINPLEQLAASVGDFIDEFVGGAADIVGQGTITTIQSIAPSGSFALGPLTFAESVLAVGAGLLAMGYILQQNVTSDTLPFTFTDLPFVGVDEEGEDEG